MRRDNVVRDKSFLLAVKIVSVYKFLAADKKEFVMSKQLLRSGTSVGANIRESEYAQSKPDFIHKLSISQKELNETMYWLELLKTTNYLTEKEFRQVYEQSEEVMKLLISILKTSKGIK